MIEREAVEIFALTFKYLQPKVARMAPKTNLNYKTNRALALPPSKFRRANPTSDQALIFVSFHQGKEKSPSAASRGKPSVAEKHPVKKPSCWHPSNVVEFQLSSHPALPNYFSDSQATSKPKDHQASMD